MQSTQALWHLTKGNLERILIPVPPLDVQETIVAELDGYRKVITPAIDIVNHFGDRGVAVIPIFS